MSAYVIVDIEVTDPVGYEAYKDLATGTVAAYGGRFLARGGHVEVLEGSWVPNRLVVLEFASTDRVKAWLDSPEYNPARLLRHRAARCNMVVVSGVA